MIKRIKNHPYTVTSLIFLFVIVIGTLLLDWHEDHYAYLLLLYFIITIGIRLDEVVSRMNRFSELLPPPQNGDEDSPQLTQLIRIRELLEKLNQELRYIRANMDRK